MRESLMQLADGAVAGARQMRQNVSFPLIESQAGAFDIQADLVGGPMDLGNQEQRHAHYSS
jgi:hypothetical protein